jgi:hypothetical protein
MTRFTDLPFVRQFDTVEHTVEVVVELRDGGEAMIRFEITRSRDGVYSINAYSLEEVMVRGRSASEVTRSWVTYGLPLIAQENADAALSQAFQHLRQHCTVYAPAEHDSYASSTAR